MLRGDVSFRLVCVDTRDAVHAMDMLSNSQTCVVDSGGDDDDDGVETLAGLVNRVSDAAPPMAAKRTLTMLRMAEMRNVPVLLNGSHCYSIGMSKVAHHSVIHAQGYRVPPSMVVARGMDERKVLEMAKKRGLEMPALFKPNAGGFGEGMQRYSDDDEFIRIGLPWEEHLGDGAVDDIGILQHQMSVDDGLIYRCFVLGDRIQCAVAARTEGDAIAVCAASAPSGVLRSWKPPSDVADACVSILRACHADTGSVELLFSRGIPYYFDVNMLSTLPTPGTNVSDGESLWSEGFDPWKEQAKHAIGKLSS